MVKSVFYDLRLFMTYYLMVMTTFSFMLMIIFKNVSSDSDGLGPFSFLIMSLRIVWGEGSFDIKESEFKIMAWFTYILIIFIGNIVFMNFLIAVVNQSYESCMQRMQSHSLKFKLYMIRDHYLTLKDEDFLNKEIFPDYIQLDNYDFSSNSEQL